LALAQKKGFAEANPTADVDGHDACRKIAILSSIAYGAFVDYKDVPCKGIRDVSYEDLALADKAGFAIKLIGSSKNTKQGVVISVEPLLLDKSHMLSGVSSVFNSVLVKGTYTGDVMFYGKGAGKLATASAVMGDIIEILCGTNPKVLPGYAENDAKVISDSEGMSRYYIRIKINGDVESTEVRQVAKSIFGEEGKIILPDNEAPSYMAVVTGYVSEKNLDAKKVELEKTLSVTCENIIRVEG